MACTKIKPGLHIPETRLFQPTLFRLTDIQRTRRSAAASTDALVVGGERSFRQGSWPPKSMDNWLEVMVVADGKMVTYHGDHLRVRN